MVAMRKVSSQMSLEGREFCLGHIKFEMPIRHTDGEARKAGNIWAQRSSQGWSPPLGISSDGQPITSRRAGLRTESCTDSSSKRRAQDKEDGGAMCSSEGVRRESWEPWLRLVLSERVMVTIDQGCRVWVTWEDGRTTTAWFCGCGLLRRTLRRCSISSLLLLLCPLYPFLST